MNEVSILRLKFNYYDLQTLALLFLQINIFAPLVTIALVILLRSIIFWIISMFNRNKYWKFMYILINQLFRKRYWGLVIDNKTYKPVSFAKIKLIKFETQKDLISKKVLASTLSDYYGRYLFNYKGEYSNLFIEVHASGFKKFYKEIDTLDHVKENLEVLYDIHLAPKTNSLNLTSFIYAVNLICNIAIFLAAAVGLLLSIYIQLTSAASIAFIMCAIYIFILYFTLAGLFKRFTLKKLEVLESLLMQKIPGAVVRLYDKKHQLHLAVTNAKGYVLLDWIPGENQILVTKKGYELVDESTGTRNKKMYLSNIKHVKLKKRFKTSQSLSTTTKDIKIRTSLQNPFAKTE